MSITFTTIKGVNINTLDWLSWTHIATKGGITRLVEEWKRLLKESRENGGDNVGLSASPVLLQALPLS